MEPILNAEAVQERLMAEISDTQSDYASVIRAIEHVELLKAEGLAAAQASSPLAAFANSQREFLQQRLRFLVESHVQTVTSVIGLEVWLLSFECCPTWSLVNRDNAVLMAFTITRLLAIQCSASRISSDLGCDAGFQRRPGQVALDAACARTR